MPPIQRLKGTQHIHGALWCMLATSMAQAASKGSSPMRVRPLPTLTANPQHLAHARAVRTNCNPRRTWAHMR